MKYLTILFLFATTISINAQDIVVNGSGLPGTYSTISAAVQAANSGDKILVSNQAFPYQEDTLFIDKDVTILPYSDITHIEFEGDIQITLDSISDLTLIGFDSNQTDIFTVFNDTTRNSLSTVNIVDCHFGEINLDQPKTSLYLSYSSVNRVRFSHGDIIGNSISGTLFLGMHNYDIYGSNFYRPQFENMDQNYIGFSNNPSKCQMYENNIRFGDIETFSDTCNIIANDISSALTVNTLDYPVNIRNNSLAQYYSINWMLSCPIQKGTNQIINNSFGWESYSFRLLFIHCSDSDNFNFRDVKFEIYNNNQSNWPAVAITKPYNQTPSLYDIGTVNRNSICSYNTQGTVYWDGNNSGSVSGDFADDLFFEGPGNSNNQNPNPSPQFLNLDLTPNIVGKNGGSDAWDNYHPNGNVGFGTMTGSKARITYLNLPTQIFDPNNIQIKAKAVHGN